jgi:tetratricopeptide (TPR) repeat protein
LNFHVPDGEQIDELQVAWPGGRIESFPEVAIGQRYLLLQDSARAVAVAPREPIQLSESDTPGLDPNDSANIFLVSRLPLPLMKYRDFEEKSVELGGKTDSKTLIYLWATTSDVSLQNLAHLGKKEVDIKIAGVRVVALSVDEVPLGKVVSPAAQDAVRELAIPIDTGMAEQRLIDQLDAVQHTLLGLELPLVFPSAVLLDEHGRVAALYRGPVSSKRIVEDAKVLDVDELESLQRAALPGRWHVHPKFINPLALAEKLHSGDFDDATLHYVQMLIRQGHDRAAGYEQLLPDKLYTFLGALFEERGRDEEAAEAYRIVLKVDEANFVARRRLASIAGRLGQYAEAADVLRLLVRANPDDVMLRHEWAVRLADAGDIQQSLAQHREVLIRQPDAIATANNLAWLLATNPDPRIRRSEEALQIARRVCEATNYARPDLLDTLAAAYASAGRISGAVSTARRALELAKDQRKTAAEIDVIEYHLKFYLDGKPYLEDPRREGRSR